MTIDHIVEFPLSHREHFEKFERKRQKIASKWGKG